MQIYQQIENEAAVILSAFQATGLNLVVTGKNSLRIKGEATRQQVEILRRWKTQLIDRLSLKCSNCGLPMQIINDGALWFCALGCESREIL